MGSERFLLMYEGQLQRSFSGALLLSPVQFSCAEFDVTAMLDITTELVILVSNITFVADINCCNMPIEHQPREWYQPKHQNEIHVPNRDIFFKKLIERKYGPGSPTKKKALRVLTQSAGANTEHARTSYGCSVPPKPPKQKHTVPLNLPPWKKKRSPFFECFLLRNDSQSQTIIQ